jgi:hypothetical protein
MATECTASHRSQDSTDTRSTRGGSASASAARIPFARPPHSTGLTPGTAAHRLTTARHASPSGAHVVLHPNAPSDDPPRRDGRRRSSARWTAGALRTHTDARTHRHTDTRTHGHTDADRTPRAHNTPSQILNLSAWRSNCPVLSCPVLSCPVLSCPVLSCTDDVTRCIHSSRPELD